MKRIKPILLIIVIVLLLGGIIYLGIQIQNPSAFTGSTQTRADDEVESAPIDTPTETPTPAQLAYTTVSDTPLPTGTSSSPSGTVTIVPTFTPVPLASPTTVASPSSGISLTPTPITSLPVAGPSHIIPYMLVGALLLVGSAFLF